MTAPAAQAAPPRRCTCPADRQAATLRETLDCPAAWAEIPDPHTPRGAGMWRHLWPARARRVTR